MAEEDVDHTDFAAAAYLPQVLHGGHKFMALLFMDDGPNIFGTWSDDGRRECISVDVISWHQEPIKHFEVRIIIEFLESSSNGEVRQCRDRASFYITADSIKAMHLKILSTLTQRTFLFKDMNFADQIRTDEQYLICPQWILQHIPNAKDLIAANELFCMRLELTTDASIHAAGLFNERRYGSQTETMEALRREVKETSTFNLVFSAPGKAAKQVFAEQQKAFSEINLWPYGVWFGNHPQKPFLQMGRGHIVRPECRPEIPPARNKSSFFEIAEYTAHLGYGFIAQHEYDMELRKSAKDERVTMKTLAVPHAGNRLYQIFIKQPTGGRIYRPGETGFVHFGELPRKEVPQSHNGGAQQHQKAIDHKDDGDAPEIAGPTPGGAIHYPASESEYECNLSTTTERTEDSVRQNQIYRERDAKRKAREQNQKSSACEETDVVAEEPQSQPVVSVEEIRAQLNAHMEEADEQDDTATSEPIGHVDKWKFYLVEDAPWAPIGYATGCMERPYVNGKLQVSTDATLEPNVLSCDNLKGRSLARALADHPTQKVFARTAMDATQYKRVIAANHDLYQDMNKKKELWDILLCNDATTTTKVDFYRTVDRQACDWSFQDDFNPEQRAAFKGLSRLPAFMATLQGPPGTGKSFFTQRILLPFFQSLNTVTQSPHQVLIVSPTNELASNVASQITAVIEQYSRREDASPVIVIRLHQDKTEQKIAWRPAAKMRARLRAPETQQPDENSDTIQGLLDETAQLYSNMISEHHKRTSRKVSGISDRRVLHVELSLGHRMLQKVGLVDAPWSEPAKYTQFLLFFRQYMENRKFILEEWQDFRAETKILREDTLRDAAVIVCTPFCASQPSVHTVVKPTVLVIEEAAQIMEPILWPLLANYTAPQNESLTAILQVGDHFQLRPIVTCPKESTPFHEQLRTSLFSRLAIAGFELNMLQEQHRMHPDIGNLVSFLFYQCRLQTHESTGHESNERARALRRWNDDFFNKNTNLLFVDLQKTHQMQDHENSSWWNVQHVVVGVALARLLCRARTKLSIQAQDIVILVPYEAQYRLYLSELAKAHTKKPELDLINVKVDKIDGFQGRESSIVIYDLTVTERLGFTMEPGRLNVGLSRAKHAMYIIGNKTDMDEAINARREDRRLLRTFLRYLENNGHIATNRFLQRQVDDWNQAHGEWLQSAVEADTQGVESLDKEIQVQAVHTWEASTIDMSTDPQPVTKSESQLAAPANQGLRKLLEKAMSNPEVTLQDIAMLIKAQPDKSPEPADTQAPLTDNAGSERDMGEIDMSTAW